MNHIGEKIKTIRKRKGLSQEELAESAKVNLRTIQRIENNQSEPRGTTLHLICSALDINTEDLLDYGKETDTTYLMFFHLSVLVFLAIPVGNIILPLILWLTKRNKITGLQDIGTNLLNFQILWSIVTYVSIISFALLKIMHYATATWLYYIFIACYVLNIILPVFYAIKLRRGNEQATYPSLIKFIK